MNLKYKIAAILDTAAAVSFFIALASAPCRASCDTVVNVGKSGQPNATIMQALGTLPPILPDNVCVVIRDTQTYSEAVTIQGFGFTYSTDTLTIEADPSFVSSAPVVNPPVASTAAFSIFVVLGMQRKRHKYRTKAVDAWVEKR